MPQLTELQIGQGETFSILVTLLQTNSNTPLDITHYEITGQIRENYTTDEIAATFNITKVPPFTSGSCSISLTEAQTLNLTQRRYVYDILISSGSGTPVNRRILEGPFIVRPAATR
jgi:hypothetical protein